MNHTQLKAEQTQREKERMEKFLRDSRDRLKKISTTKIRTTMINALQVIEEDFADCPEFKKVFEAARKKILDKGNDQIRNLEIEFDHYQIEWLRNRYEFTIKQD